MKMELISVIVPVYNVEPYLDECVASIVNQTYSNLEIILVDDGSPDRCPEICDRWEKRDPRIRVIHKKNGGLSDARNVGIAVASGDYISFVDSDDVVTPSFIEYLYRALQETEAGLSECSYQRFAGALKTIIDDRSQSVPKLQTPEDALLFLSTQRCQPRYNSIVWDKLFQRKLVEEERFPLGYFGQDILFMTRVFAKCKKVALIENRLYYWRNTPGSAMHQFPVHTLHVMEMYYQSAAFLKDKYPVIAKNCKVYVCSLSVGCCYSLHYDIGVNGRDEAKKEMLSIRRKTQFTKDEWVMCSFADKIRIISSSPSIIDLYVRARHTVNVISQKRQRKNDSNPKQQ